MANFDKAQTKVLHWEGGKVNDPDDMGGKTNSGITQSTYNIYYSGDVYDMTPEQRDVIYRYGYWNRIKGDRIESQSVAELLYDYAVNSGPVTAVKKIQSLVGVDTDGVVGPKTLEAINRKPAKLLFAELHDVRVAYYRAIVARKPSQKKFLKGWLARVESYKFES